MYKILLNLKSVKISHKIKKMLILILKLNVIEIYKILSTMKLVKISQETIKMFI